MLRHAERLTDVGAAMPGSADALIPVDWTRQLAERLRVLGRTVDYEEIPEGNHDSPVRHVDWAAGLDFISGH